MLHFHFDLGYALSLSYLTNDLFSGQLYLAGGHQTLGASHIFPNRHLMMFGSAQMQAKILAHCMLVILLRKRPSEQR